MFQCSFTLNRQPMSRFQIAALSVPAYSGRGRNINQRSAACIPGLGPIPPGEYYIFDRQSGGRLEWFKNLINDQRDWFALYAIDGKIDDETYCDRVNRGQFRLHPKGPRGISEGCITVDALGEFQLISTILRSIRPATVSGTQLKAYGKVVVR